MAAVTKKLMLFMTYHAVYAANCRWERDVEVSRECEIILWIILRGADQDFAEGITHNFILSGSLTWTRNAIVCSEEGPENSRWKFQFPRQYAQSNRWISTTELRFCNIWCNVYRKEIRYSSRSKPIVICHCLGFPGRKGLCPAWSGIMILHNPWKAPKLEAWPLSLY
jgi:hypothetical protein